MRTLAYIPMHYGLEYMEQTIKSLDPCVEKIVVLYTDRPSYGHVGTMVCPESENELKEKAFAASSKIQWEKIHSGNEGQHRNMAFNFANGYDVMVTLDTDEVWKPDELEEAIRAARDTNARYIGVDGFVNFWRSFNYVVVDWFHPVRLHNLKARDGQKDIKSTIYHMGYAQSRKIMEYKFQVHGHKNEIRPHYLQNKYFAWTGIDCGVNWLHPASNQIWQDAEPYDKNQLPDLLKQHPNFEKELI